MEIDEPPTKKIRECGARETQPSLIAPTGISPRQRNPEEALLVTRAYIKECIYSWNIPVSQYARKKKISICLNRGREESVGKDDVSIVCARKYEMVRVT